MKEYFTNIEKVVYTTLFIIMLFTSIIFPQAPDTAWSKMFTPVGILGIQTTTLGFCGHQTPDGGYIAVGVTVNPWLKGYLVKTNSTGDTLWTRQFFDDIQTYGSFTCTGVELTNDNGYLLSGFGTHDTTDVIWLIKTNSVGNILWTNYYIDPLSSNLGHVTSEMRITPDNGCIVVGSSSSISTFFSDVFVLKTKADGSLDWFNTFGSPDTVDEGLSVELAYSGGYIVSGIYDTPSKAFIMKLDESGKIVWRNCYNSLIDNPDDFQSLKRTLDGNYVLGGANGNFYLLKFDSNGSVLGYHEYGNVYIDPEGTTQYLEEDALSICPTKEGGFIMTGHSEIVLDGKFEIYVVKVNSNLEMEWDKIIKVGEGDNHAEWIEQTSDGGYIIIGDVRLVADEINYLYLLKLNGGSTFIDDHQSSKLYTYELYQNYPNPFNPTTVICYQLPTESYVTLKVYNLLGGEVATLVDEEKAAGSYKIEFDASSLSSGIYFYKLQSGGFVSSKKMILIK